MAYQPHGHTKRRRVMVESMEGNIVTRAKKLAGELSVQAKETHFLLEKVKHLEDINS